MIDLDKKHLTEEELIERYDAVLDLQTVSLRAMYNELTLQPSRVIKAMDPVAYRTGLADFADYLEQTEGVTAEGYVS